MPEQCKKQADLSEIIRVRFFKKFQDGILISERNRKWILRFFTKQINPRVHQSESTSRVDLFSKETQNPFSVSFGFKNPISWIFFKKRTRSLKVICVEWLPCKSVKTSGLCQLCFVSFIVLKLRGLLFLKRWAH